MADKNYGEIKENKYRTGSDVLAGTETNTRTTTTDDGEKVTGYGYTPEGAQKDLEDKLDKK